jgi:RNA polymerase sigma factor (TIGR02999 family)
MDDITQLLHSAHAGDQQASRKLFEAVYADLKRMARSRLDKSVGPADLSTTALVHESFLRLIDRGQLRLEDRLAFFAYVGRVMRNVVIDEVRARQAEKRGGHQAFVTLTTGVADEAFDDHRLLAVNTALDALERVAPQFHQLVEMRYFAGLSIGEVAEVRGVSTRTVEREWEKARAFLHKLMEEH